MEDHQLQTVSWTEKSYPLRIQHEDRYFESKPEYAVQHWRREHTDAEMYVRTPATLDECGRHFIRHVLFDYGGNFGNNIPAQARLNYMDDRYRQIRHDFKVLYHSHPSPSSFAWTYFSVRMMLTRIAVATVSRRAAILFATEEYELMKRIAGCYDYLLLSVRGNWQPLHAPLVALMVLHLGMRSTLNVASSPYWCLKPTVEDPSAVYQLEQPTAAVDLAAAFQAVPPEAAASRDVQNSLLLLQALHAGEWFRFAELVVGLNLSFFQKCYVVSFLPFVRFRAVADTFGRPRKTGESLQKARLCDPVDVSYLTEKLLFANEDDCRSFLDDCGVVMANAPPNFNSTSSSSSLNNNNNNNNNLVIYMQGTHPQQNQQQPSPTEMFDRLRSRKIKIDDSPVLEYGIYLPHPDFLNLDKAKINSTTPGKDDSSYYNDASDSQNIPIPNALMLIQQPDSLENDNNSEISVCGSLSEWMQSVRDDVDHKKNPFDENSWTPLRTFAPSMAGVDVSAALVSFDRLIDHERSRLAARRVAVLGHKLLADFKESVVIPLDELYLTEMRVFSSQEQRERRDVVEKLREQKKRKEQEEKSRKESELLAQKEKELLLQQQQQQQLDAAKLSAAATTNTTTQQKPGLFSSFSSSKKLDELDNSDGAPKIPTNSAVTSGNPFASSISASNNTNNNNQNFFATTTTTTTAKAAQDSGNPFASSSSSSINMNKATFATTKVEEKTAVSILHHQEPQQQHHSEKHVHFEPSKNQVVVFSKEQSKEQHEIIIQTPQHMQHDEEQQTRTFPYIDDRGYYSWLPTTIDQLKKMWTTFQNINNHDDSSTFTNDSDSFFFPEYSKTKTINQKQQDFLAQQQRRVETDSVHLKIAVITPLDSVNPPSSQDYNSSTSSFDYYRTLTAATTSLFYDADSSDRESRLLCRRTFVNGDLVEIGGDSSSMGEELNDQQNSNINTTKTRLEEFERICNSPTFSVSAYNIPWNRSLELCSMLNFNIENRDNNSNIKSGGGGVLAVLVLPEFFRERNEISEKFQNGRTTQPAASVALKEFESLIGDFFSSFLRQEKFVTGKERKNGGLLLYPRGVVLLASISSDDREAPLPLFQECFERKWSEFRVKFAEMNRILNENHQNNSDKMLLHHQANKSGKNKSTTGSKAIMSREEKLDALRRQRNWQDSSVFWNNFESNNNNSSNALSEDYATKSLLHALPPAMAPPMIIIPTKDNYVRATLGSAISDSMNVVLKEIRTRQIEKIY